MITYTQTNTYNNSRVIDKDSVQGFSYTRMIRTVPLRTVTDKKVFYNKELNMHFESPESYYSHEIEVEDVQVDIIKQSWIITQNIPICLNGNGEKYESQH